MSSEKKGKGILVAAIIWCVILVALGASYKFIIAPYFKGREERKTGSKSPYDHIVDVAVDSFSGYCVLRSRAVEDQLKAKRIKLNLEDDAADYEGRMKALRSGKVQMAIFTIDSFVLNGAKLGAFPASIVLVIDETKGADAMVAYKGAVASIRDLDNPDARFVLTSNSPSEFLARTVIAHFSLPSLPEKWWVGADGAEAVYKEFRAARKTDKRAYVLWEPYVSKALEEPDAHVLIDSSKLKGYIVDVLVAQREFLSEKPDVAHAVVEAYLRAAYSCGSRDNGMTELVADDANISADEAQKIAAGIEWKSTLENYAHFGLLSQNEMGGLQHLEDIIANISDVLLKTGAISEDPLSGKAHTIYYDRILRDLKAQDFHPGRKLNILEGVAAGLSDLKAIRADKELAPLTESRWEGLVPVGELRIKPISFGRGTARLNVQSRRELEALVKRLRSFPQYYLVVTGHARADGDVEANLRLMNERARLVVESLVRLGLHTNRVKANTSKPSKQNGSAQSVSFTVGQPGY